MGVVVLAALVGATLRLGAADSEPTICILQHPPFAPLKTRLFMPQIYPDSPPPEPAPARPVNEAQLRSLVQSTLNTRFQGDQQRVAEGLSVFDSPQIAAIIPDPRLGAGLALLLGTAGGGAIEAIEGEVFESVEFAVPPATDHAYGQVVIDPDTNKPKIIINEKYQHEDPRLLGVALAHESLHQDADAPPAEELMASAIEALTYGQFVEESPGLARSGTELARRQNTKLMALVNSRDAQGNIRLLTAQGNSVYPGSNNPLPDFGFAFVSAGLG